jgi:hypothetical protein
MKRTCRNCLDDRCCYAGLSTNLVPGENRECWKGRAAKTRGAVAEQRPTGQSKAQG